MNFACYRLPYSDSYVRIESSRDPVQIEDFREIGKIPGFIIAPFCGPAQLISADSMESFPVPSFSSVRLSQSDPDGDPDREYIEAFRKFHARVLSGNVSKLVLARKKEVSFSEDPLTVFHKACSVYPRLMIMLFHTEISGTWIVASPEILLESKGGILHHTVALAGTMPFMEGYGEWSIKNREEQHIVETYIENKISRICRDVVKDGPVTMRAGHLQHLRTDFRFKGSSVGEIVSNLHPTPAVMGFPSESARTVICNSENLDRRFYSGFAGPVSINGDSHLYVSIRCAELFPNRAVLYAGGGIMPDSDCLVEWSETERKMQTIEKIL